MRSEPPLRETFAALLRLAPTERARFVAGLAPDEAAALFYDWSLWARPTSARPKAIGSTG